MRYLARRMSSDEDTRSDEAASAVPDPRDRRRGTRRQGPRRTGEDRRAGTEPPPGVERRAGDRRATDRRQSDRRGELPIPDLYRGGQRSVNEYPLSPDELDFINCINGYKQRHGRPFPTWSEVLHVLRALGYKKTGGASDGAD